MKKNKNILDNLARQRKGRFTPNHAAAGAHKDKSKYDRKNFKKFDKE